jgi:hypothetical protein
MTVERGDLHRLSRARAPYDARLGHRERRRPRFRNGCRRHTRPLSMRDAGRAHHEVAVNQTHPDGVTGDETVSGGRVARDPCGCGCVGRQRLAGSRRRRLRSAQHHSRANRPERQRRPRGLSPTILRSRASCRVERARCQPFEGKPQSPEPAMSKTTPDRWRGALVSTASVISAIGVMPAIGSLGN